MGLPTRLQALQAVVSENLELYRRYNLARAALLAASIEDAWRPITAKVELHSWAELEDGANEAFLFHGTSPSAAISILQSGFSVDLAGASVGTMFGAGVYMAERSSKADEYAKGDDIQPDICAVLVCRVLVGRCYVVLEPGDYAQVMVAGNAETVIGDREAAVGTYREFVVGSGARIYPEFAVIYKRVFGEGQQCASVGADGQKAPPVDAPLEPQLAHGQE